MIGQPNTHKCHLLAVLHTVHSTYGVFVYGFVYGTVALAGEDRSPEMTGVAFHLEVALRRFLDAVLGMSCTWFFFFGKVR
jgi:hypothetical protein